MGRVERVEQPEERREKGERQAEPRRQLEPIGHTPTKAEGEERDVDEALERDETANS